MMSLGIQMTSDLATILTLNKVGFDLGNERKRGLITGSADCQNASATINGDFATWVICWVML